MKLELYSLFLNLIAYIVVLPYVLAMLNDQMDSFEEVNPKKLFHLASIWYCSTGRRAEYETTACVKLLVLLKHYTGKKESV